MGKRHRKQLRLTKPGPVKATVPALDKFKLVWQHTTGQDETGNHGIASLRNDKDPYR